MRMTVRPHLVSKTITERNSVTITDADSSLPEDGQQLLLTIVRSMYLFI